MNLYTSTCPAVGNPSRRPLGTEEIDGESVAAEEVGTEENTATAMVSHRGASLQQLQEAEDEYWEKATLASATLSMNRDITVDQISDQLLRR